MSRPVALHGAFRPVVRGLCIGLLPLAALACSPAADDDAGVERTGTEAARVAELIDVAAEPQDSLIFEDKIAWAQAEGLADMPVGEAIAALGRTFVGAPYVPGTLEIEGPERLVVNLRELDCVTFIESVLAIVRVVQAGTPDYASYKRELMRIRYRDGVLAGYPSRLHYFSEWIADNEAKGIVRDVTRQLGGAAMPGPLTFMTEHRDAYRQLEDDSVLVEIGRIETELSGRERFYIAEGSIAAIESNIRDGDIIAATSTLDGLDIAHTGFALWVGDRLHLMHAPLVGSVVEISERPLAERLQNISAQDGIMVARPADIHRDDR
jgi:hypothetical protein